MELDELLSQRERINRDIPQWQRVLLPALFEVLRGLEPTLEVQVVATTHAPLVLASVEPFFEEPRDALFHFDVREGAVQIHRQPWVHQGDVVGWLTSEVFDLEQACSRDAERAIEAAEAFMRGEMSALPVGLQTRERVLNQGNQPQHEGLAQQTTKREMLTYALRKQPACSLLFNTL